MNYRSCVLFACILLSIAAGLPLPALSGETLSNGIVLPDAWPPKIEKLTREPLATPPYLANPPAVIPIDVGRQLFVDDFLIAETTLKRTHHRPEYHPANPVFGPDRAWEGSGARARAGVFSDGVWYDPADKLFKAWYWAGSTSTDTYRYSTCYAFSPDGIHWTKPELDVVPGTNIVLRDEENLRRNSGTVWLDLAEKDPARRYKMFRVVTEEQTVDGKKRTWHRMRVSFSPDGIHWTFAADADPCGDRSTVFHNGLRGVWVYSLRDGTAEVSRCRRYCESADVLAGLHWANPNMAAKQTLWVGADGLDPDRSDIPLRRVPERPWDLVPSQLYNLDCIAYENLLLGMFSIWRGHPLERRPKINEVCVGFSRDGFHWSRPDRRAFCGVSENPQAWNFGNVQSAGGCCLVVGDKLYFYVGGAAGRAGGFHPDPSCTGLAVLRRDGFTSLDAGADEATLTTRPIRFAGKHLFVNVAADCGELRAEILDEAGRVIEPFTRANCRPATADSTLAAVTWNHAEDLAPVSGKPVRLRFSLKSGSLYSFWVSSDASGASRGFVAGGGPGFNGPTDTAGKAAYEAAATLEKKFSRQEKQQAGG
ncbi:MAG: glycosyl hydrolase family 32 [Pirellulales bacterium]|nr:glycosyl hydrolase family 32 [Pirellulales bacterium]